MGGGFWRSVPRSLSDGQTVLRFLTLTPTQEDPTWCLMGPQSACLSSIPSVTACLASAVPAGLSLRSRGQG